MTRDELVKTAAQGKLEDVITELFSGIPQCCKKRPAEYARFREQLGSQLKVDPANILLVGSGRFGFSLAPHKFGRPFTDKSDLDLVIVSDQLFDTAWLEMIRYDFKSLTFDRDIADALKEHRHNNVFWGYIEPHRLKIALSFYRRIWFPAIAALGVFYMAAGRDVKARVYRTLEHAKNYHRFGLRLVTSRQSGETQ